MKKTILLVFLVLFAIALKAQWMQLTDTSFLGGEMKSLVKTSDAAFLATEGGLFKTVNDGDSWSLCTIGIDSNSNNTSMVTAFNDTLFALIDVDYGKIYRSTNNGSSWGLMNNTGILNYSQTEYIASTSDKIFRLTRKNGCDTLYTSTNGMSWTKGAGIGSGTTIRLYDISSSNIYFYKRDSVFYTADGTDIDTLSFSGLNRERFNYDQLAGCKNYPSLFYSEGDTVYRYNDLSSSWDMVFDSPLGIQTVGLHVTESAVFASVIEPDPFAPPLYMKLVLYRSTNNGDAWAEVSNPGMPLAIFKRAGIIQSGSGELIGNDQFGNNYHSSDTGLTWTEGDIGFYSAREDYLVSINNSLLTIASKHGIIKSTDFGNTWEPSNNGLTSILGFYTVSELFKVGNTLFCTANKSASVEQDTLTLYKSTNEGDTWTEVPNLSGSSLTNFYYAGSNGSTFFLRFYNRNNPSATPEIYRVSNISTTWEDIVSHLPDSIPENSFISLNGKGDTLFLFTQVEITYNYKIFMSIDNGNTWADVSLPSGIFYERSYLRTRTDALICFAGEFQRPVLLANDYNHDPEEAELWIFNGASWDSLGSASTVCIPGIDNDLFIYQNNQFYIGNRIGVYASADEGINWRAVQNNSNLYLGMQKRTLRFVGDTIFLGSASNGIWKARNQALSTVTTSAIADITGTSATCGGNVTNSGGLPITMKGVCWSTSPHPTTSNNKTNDGTGTGSFTSYITGLTSATTYYVKAYAVNSMGTSYGNEISFYSSGAGINNTEENSLHITTYPNPAANNFTIELSATNNNDVLIIEIYDLHGNKILQQIDENIIEGKNTLKINTTSLEDGLYVVKLFYGNTQRIQKLMIIK